VAMYNYLYNILNCPKATEGRGLRGYLLDWDYFISKS
jgi:hypothetical protein